MKTTAVICTLARERELDACLESIRKQSRKPDEIVIVSDRKLSIRDARVIVETRRGLPKARNAAIRKVRSDVVMFFDDDTILERDYIKNILKVFETHPDAGGVTGRIKRRGASGRGIPGKLMRIYARVFGISGFFVTQAGIGRILGSGFTSANFEDVRSITRVEWLSGCNMSYRSSAIKRTGLFDENLKGNAYYEDTDYSNRVLRSGFRLYATPDAVIDHIVTPTSRESLPRLKYYQLVNQKRFFRRNIQKGRFRLIRNKIAHASLLVPVIGYSLYSRNKGMLREYIRAEIGV
jgi:GT2 family glycosyltransferase